MGNTLHGEEGYGKITTENSSVALPLQSMNHILGTPDKLKTGLLA